VQKVSILRNQVCVLLRNVEVLLVFDFAVECFAFICRKRGFSEEHCNMVTTRSFDRPDISHSTEDVM
jgi:hypothetical protein